MTGEGSVRTPVFHERLENACGQICVLSLLFIDRKKDVMV